LAPGAVAVGTVSMSLPALAGEDAALTSFLQALPSSTTDDNQISYLREVTRTHAAAVVVSGGTKPTSTYELERIDAPLQVIAHLSGPHSKYWFTDAPALRQYLDTVMRQGLRIAAELAVLGDVGDDVEGLLEVSGRVVLPLTVGDDQLAAARRAQTSLEIQNFNAQEGVFIFHPSDWEDMDLIEATGSGEYKKGDASPIQRPGRTLWGTPVALSTAATAGTGVLVWRPAVTFVEHSEGAQIEISDAAGFSTNEVLIRAEFRAQLAIHNPGGIVEFDLV
jgi:HK97 family phage major capsid protein